MKITTSQLKRIIKEEMAAAMGGKDPQRFLHGYESGHPMDDEGYMVKSRMADVKEMAEVICDLIETGDQLPAWVQDLVASAHTDLEHVKDYLSNDEKMRGAGELAIPQPTPAFAESKKPRGGMLLEGHSRITPDEMRAWMDGDWGFVSESTEQKRCEDCGTPMADDDKKCGVCRREFELHHNFVG